jgi:glycine/D-amino acid oxidase-like deaminating enzyme
MPYSGRQAQESIMINAIIRCAGCGFEGKSEEGFRSEGHDPFRGQLVYRCCSCSSALFVDPMEALGSSRVTGVPARRRLTRSPGHRCVSAFQGLFFIGLVLFLLAGFGPHWWAYLTAAILLVAVWLCAEPHEETV